MSALSPAIEWLAGEVMATWPRRFPEAMTTATRYFYSRQYLDAYVDYLAAARSAPERWLETIALESAWCALERAHGGKSELEVV